MTTLYDIKKGEKAKIIDIKNRTTRVFCSKMGIECGSIVTCIEKFGAVVIQKNRQQIALGAKISQEIMAEVLQ